MIVHSHQSEIIAPALMDCNTVWVTHPRFGCPTLGLSAPPSVWVPHPRDAFVFVARVGEHDAVLLCRINRIQPPGISKKSGLIPEARNLSASRQRYQKCRRHKEKERLRLRRAYGVKGLRGSFIARDLPSSIAISARSRRNCRQNAGTEIESRSRANADAPEGEKVRCIVLIA